VHNELGAVREGTRSAPRDEIATRQTNFDARRHSAHSRKLVGKLEGKTLLPPFFSFPFNRGTKSLSVSDTRVSDFSNSDAGVSTDRVLSRRWILPPRGSAGIYIRQIFRVQRKRAREAHASRRAFAAHNGGNSARNARTRRRQTVSRYCRDILIRFSDPASYAAGSASAAFAKLVLCFAAAMQSPGKHRNNPRKCAVHSARFPIQDMTLFPISRVAPAIANILQECYRCWSNRGDRSN